MAGPCTWSWGPGQNLVEVGQCQNSFGSPRVYLPARPPAVPQTPHLLQIHIALPTPHPATLARALLCEEDALLPSLSLSGVFSRSLARLRLQTPAGSTCASWLITLLRAEGARARVQKVPCKMSDCSRDAGPGPEPAQLPREDLSGMQASLSQRAAPHFPASSRRAPSFYFLLHPGSC